MALFLLFSKLCILNEKPSKMVTVKGIFDGKNVRALEELPEGKRYKVLITLLEEIKEDEEIRYVFSNSDSFSFWVNEKEDIYQEYLKK